MALKNQRLGDGEDWNACYLESGFLSPFNGRRPQRTKFPDISLPHIANTYGVKSSQPLSEEDEFR